MIAPWTPFKQEHRVKPRGGKSMPHMESSLHTHFIIRSSNDEAIKLWEMETRMFVLN